MVQCCQVIEAGRCGGVARSQLLLPDRQLSLHQRFRLSIQRMVLFQVNCSLMEEACRFWKSKGMVVDEISTDLGMGKQSLTLGPGCELNFREDLIDGSHRSLGPLSLLALIHIRLENDLHQAMDGERVVLSIATNERKAQQGTNGFVKEDGILGNRLELRPKLRGTLHEQFFRDGVGGEEGADAQQVGGYRTLPFDLLKGEGPGAINRVGVLFACPTAPFEQDGLSLSIALQVGGDTASCLFDIGSRLVKSQGKAIHLFHNLFSFGAIPCGCLFQGGIKGKHSSSSQQEQHALLLIQLLYLDTVGKRSYGLCPSREQDMPITSCGKQILLY